MVTDRRARAPDLHTDNVLAGHDGTLTGIIDWDGACAGSHRFDLVRLAYDLDGQDQPVWDDVEATGIELRVLRAYVAHHALCARLGRLANLDGRRCDNAV